MNWFKSVFSRKAPKPDAQEKDPELEKAYAIGRSSAEEMSTDLESFISRRFVGLKDRYIGVFQDGLNSAKSSTDCSPIISARIDFTLFHKNIELLKGNMIGEIEEYMGEWIKFSALMEMESEVRKLIEQSVKNITEDIFFSGVGVFTEKADELKDADDAWRRANPKLAAQLPLHDKEY